MDIVSHGLTMLDASCGGRGASWGSSPEVATGVAATNAVTVFRINDSRP